MGRASLATPLTGHGLHHRMVQRGRVDDDGYLIGHPQEPAWNLLHVRGPIDVPALAEAVALVAAAADIFGLRLRRGPDGPLLESRPVPPITLTTAAVDAVVDEHGNLAADAARDLTELLFEVPDLRVSPAGRVHLASAGSRDHLLVVSLDHFAADGWSLGLFVRRLALTYRALLHGDTERARRLAEGPSFAEFLRRQPGEPAQRARLAEWARLLEPFPTPGPRFRPPGGVLKDPAAYRITDITEIPLTGRVSRVVGEVSDLLGLTRPQLLLAVSALLATRWSDGPQPISYVRHGRDHRADIGVIGPLMEQCIALPSRSASTVRDWLLDFHVTNATTPPLHGRSLREINALAPRHVAVNVIPPTRAIALDEHTRATPVNGAALDPLWPGGRPELATDAAVWISYYLDEGNDIRAFVEYDIEVLPDPAVLIDGLTAILTGDLDGPARA